MLREALCLSSPLTPGIADAIDVVVVPRKEKPTRMARMLRGLEMQIVDL
jgi:hypothetical protein